ncbi:hypothetical protein AB0H36_11710 [Kribbella sp. NPDC050820]|uniref:hypothetical protein n=1 Tax=Kribbella sp. NPDC050820 TaxID=3155408 RepID=UPI0033C14812
MTLAASGAVSAILLTALQYLLKLTDLSFWLDLVVRLAKTFLASLAASIAAGAVFDVTKFDWSTALNVAVLATLSALAKGLLARQPAAPNPSTLPITTYKEANG